MGSEVSHWKLLPQERSKPIQLVCFSPKLGIPHGLSLAFGKWDLELEKQIFVCVCVVERGGGDWESVSITYIKIKSISCGCPVDGWFKQNMFKPSQCC